MRTSGLLAMLWIGSWAGAQVDDGTLQRAREALSERRYDRCLELLATAPETPERHRLEGEVHFFQGELENAVRVLRHYLALAGQAPEAPRARFRLAEALGRLGRFEEAVQLTRTGLAQVADPARRAALARLLLERARDAAYPTPADRKPDHGRALAFLEEALPFCENDAALAGEVRFATGKVRGLLGQPREAIAWLAPLAGIAPAAPPVAAANPRREYLVPEADPDRPWHEPRLEDPAARDEAARLVADALLATGEPGRAREVYEQLFTQRPEGPEAPACLLGVARSHGLPAPAYRHALAAGTAALERLIASFPKDARVAEALDLLARAHRAFDRPEAALRYLGDLVGRFPDSDLAAPAAQEIARIHRTRRAYDLALEAYDRALAAFPNHRIWKELKRERIDCEYERAVDARRRGDRAGAARLFLAFLEQEPLDPRVPSILLALGQMEEKAERPTTAARYYTTVASRYPEAAEARAALLRRASLEEQAGDFQAARATLASIPGAGGRARLQEVERPALSLETRNVRGEPVPYLTARNVEQVEFRLYRISASDYFEKHLGLENVARLDVPLIRPDQTWTWKVPDYRKYQRFELPVELPGTGAGAFVLSAVAEELRGTTLVLKSGLRLLARTAGDRVDVLVGRGHELTPVAEATVRVAGADRVVARGRTDAAGGYTGRILEAARPAGTIAVLVEHGEEVAWARLEVAGRAAAEAESETAVLLWTDRTHYRPGDTLRFWAVAARPDGKPFDVEAVASEEIRIRRFELLPDAGGVFGGALVVPAVPKDSALTVRVARGGSVIAAQVVQVAPAAEELVHVEVRPARARVRLGEEVSFAVLATDRSGHPASHERLEYRLSGDPAPRALQTDGNGRATVRLPSDRHGLADAIALDVFRTGRWQAGAVVAVVWDGFRARVEPERTLYLLGEAVRATVSAESFDGVRRASEVTVVVRRVRETGPSEEVCRVPVHTAARGQDVMVELPIPGEGAFSIVLEGDEGMVASGAAVFISGPEDPQRIRILGGPRAVRPGDTLAVRVHCRADRAAAVLVAANHHDHRIRRVELDRGLNEIPVEIREQDLPWIRLRIGAGVEGAFHSDELTVAVEDPLRVEVAVQPPSGLPDRNVTVGLKVADGAGRPAPGSAVILLVPEALAPLYRGVFQGVAERFVGDTRTADSPLVSSYPFLYAAGAERLRILDERASSGPALGSNWATVVDRNAVLAALGTGRQATRSAAVFEEDIAARLRGMAGQPMQQVELPQEEQLEVEAQGRAPRAQQLHAGWRGEAASVANPAFLNQGPGQVFMARSEFARILALGVDGDCTGVFQDLDGSRNAWNAASVLVCARGSIPAVPEDIEVRRRRLAEVRLAQGFPGLAPRVFRADVGKDGRGAVTFSQPEGEWRVVVLVAGHERGRFGTAADEVRAAWPVRARVIAPRSPLAGDSTSVDVVVEAEAACEIAVGWHRDGAEAERRTVALAAGEPVRVRFPVTIETGAGALRGTVSVGERRMAVETPIAGDRVELAAGVVRQPAAEGDPGAGSALAVLRSVLAEPRGNLARAAWVVARLAEIRAQGADASADLELEGRLAELLLAAAEDGGWPAGPPERQADAETSVLVAWALGDAEKAGLEIPAAVRSRLVAHLRAAFASARDEGATTALLLGLSRLEAVDFAFLNRLYRERETLSGRDLAIVLLLVRRQDEASPMVTSLAERLAGKAGGDGSFAARESVDALSGERATTALAALALVGLDDAVTQRALACLDERPISVGREAAGVALEAVVRAEVAPKDGRCWSVRPAQDEVAAPVPVRLRREVHLLPLEVRGYTLPRGFGDVVDFRDRGTATECVAEGARVRVTLNVELPCAWPLAVIAEALPAGAWLVPGSASGTGGVAERDGLLEFHVRPPEGRRSGVRWHSLSYQLEGALAGTCAFRLPGAIVPGGPALAPRFEGGTNRITIAPGGEEARKGYELSPAEHEALGRLHWIDGEFDRAEPHLDAVDRKWRLRAGARVRVAALRLDMAVRRNDPRAMVEQFEILKEGSPERSVPLRKVLPVAEAYAALGEFERALQVQRGALDGFFRVDFGLGKALWSAGDLAGFCGFVRSLVELYPAGPVTRDGRYFLGQTLLEQALGLGPDRREQRVKWLADAAAAFRAAMTSGGGGPETEAAAFALVGTLLEQERYEEAAALAGRAVSLEPQSVLRDGFEYVEAYALFEAGRYDDAEKICRRLATGEYRDAAGRLGPSVNRFLALHMLAKIRHARGDIPGAVEAYRKVRDKFGDAAQALEYFEWRVLELAELTELAVNEDRSVRLAYKNVDRVQIQAYRVDLMTLYLRERSLSRIASINLAGIQPFFEGVFAVRPSTYRMDEVVLLICREPRERTGPGDPIALVLPEAGAYLLVVRSGETESTAMVLRTDLRMDVQTTARIGKLRATVYDRACGAFASRVEVKFVGSGDRAFTTARTDLRGVAEAEGIEGEPTVIARRGDHYAFFRSAVPLGRPSTRDATKPGSEEAELRLGNVRKQLEQLNLDNRLRVEEGQKGRGGVPIKALK
ncbi:MAG: tetratricopeptide repeat protein [Planctomycetes bacterium]|nr:tetratricopeptide repeat protein [Planctomycetota bacterium]